MSKFLTIRLKVDSLDHAEQMAYAFLRDVAYKGEPDMMEIINTSGIAKAPERVEVPSGMDFKEPFDAGVEFGFEDDTPPPLIARNGPCTGVDVEDGTPCTMSKGHYGSCIGSGIKVPSVEDLLGKLQAADKRSGFTLTNKQAEEVLDNATPKMVGKLTVTSTPADTWDPTLAERREYTYTTEVRNEDGGIIHRPGDVVEQFKGRHGYWLNADTFAKRYNVDLADVRGSDAEKARSRSLEDYAVPSLMSKQEEQAERERLLRTPRPARTVMANGTAKCLNCGRRVRVKATVISRHTIKAKGANLTVCSNSHADASTYATDYVGEIL